MKNFIYFLKLVSVGFFLSFANMSAMAENDEGMVWLDTMKYPGQDQVVIEKFLDSKVGVLCYVLKAKNNYGEKFDNGNFAFNGNGVGSISCVKLQKKKK